MARQLYATEFVQLAGSANPAPDLPFSVWTDLTAGSNVTSQIVGPDGSSAYTAKTDSQGNIAPFRGPDGYLGNLFVDTGAAYRFMLDSPSLLDYLVSNVGVGGGGTSAVTSVAGRTGDVTVSKIDVGLSNVDNTADASKPVSSAQQTALNAKANDNVVPHLAGPNTFTGVNTFTSSPVVPTPVNPTDAANRAYVLANAGTGGSTAIDDTSTLTTGTTATTSVWSSSNTKSQINALLNTAGGIEQVQDIVGALIQGGGGTYNDVAGTITLPSANAGGSSAPLDASAAPYNVSTTGTRDANGAGLLAAVQAAGKRPVTLPPGRYKLAVNFTDEDINIDAPGAVFVQPSVAGDTQPIMIVERTLGTPVAVGPTRVVEWGPRLPGGVSKSAKYTAIDLTSGNYANWKAGDLCHISSQDAYPWTWSGQGIADYSTSTGLYYQAAFVPLLGVGLLVINTTNGGPQEQMMVQGSTSGATGLIMSDMPGNTAGGITATQNHILFGSVTGDFVSGETLTRITGGNPQDPSGGTVATVGQPVGTVSGLPMLIANRLLDDAYGVVTAANIAAGSAAGYGTGTRYPVQTDNTVRLRKVDRAPICVVKANFDIDASPGAQDAYVASTARTDMVKFRGVFGAQFDSRIFGSWTRAVVVTSCYMGRWRGVFDGLPNHALLDQNGFGYGFECKSASEGNTFELIGRNLRHAFTTNPNGRTFSTTNNNAVLDFGTPKNNIVQNSVVLASYTNSFDTHPGDYFTVFRNCVAIGGGSGGRYNSDGGAQFASRGFGTHWINCRSVNSVEGINWLGPEHDPGFDHTARVENCTVSSFQSRGFYSVDSVTSRASLVIDGGRYTGDGSATNAQYAHECIAIGKGIKATIKGEVEVGGFNAFPLRMREVSTTTVQSELDIISMLIDYRGATTSNAQGIRVDGTLARAVIGANAIVLRLAAGSTPGGVITNRAGTTAFKIGHIVSERAVPLFQTASAGGTPTSANLIDLGSSGSGAGGGTQVTVDGVAVSTFDVSSTPVVQALYIGGDVTATPAAGTTLADLSQLQTSLPAGSYIVKALLYYTMSATGGGTLRFGFGGAGSANASIVRGRALECTNTTSGAMLGGILTGLGTAGATATQNVNVYGTSPGVTTPVWVELESRLLVTSTGGVLGVTWTLSNGATATGTLNAGSYIEFTKVT